MKAIFVTKFPHDQNLPPFTSDDGGDQLYYNDNGTFRGGYSCIGHVPHLLTDTVMIMVEASQIVINNMKSQSQYLFLGQLGEDEDDEPTLATAQYLIDWFDAHPAYKEKANAAGIDTVQELITAICKWHGVTRKILKEAVGL